MGGGLTLMVGEENEIDEYAVESTMSIQFDRVLNPIKALMKTYMMAREDSLLKRSEEKSFILNVLCRDGSIRAAFLAFLLSKSTAGNLLFYENVTEIINQYSMEDIDRIVLKYVDKGSEITVGFDCSAISDEMRDYILSEHSSKVTTPQKMMDILIQIRSFIIDDMLQLLPMFYSSVFFKLWERFETKLFNPFRLIPSPDNSYTILIAEDSIPIVKILSRSFFSKGYTVEVARDGKEALDRILVKKYTAALFDMNMPEKSGAEVTKIFREYEPLLLASQSNRRRLTIIGMTAHTDKAIGETVLSAGMDDFLRKPFDVSCVLDLVFKYNSLYHITYKHHVIPELPDISNV